jgi:6-phosphogluconate dehydrogenase
MQIALIGLGKMGYNIALNLHDHGHSVVAYDLSETLIQQLARDAGATPASTLEAVVQALAPRRVLWLMVPAGPPVDSVLQQLVPLLAAGDIVIDGGNSNYRDSMRRHRELAEKGIELLDCGTSGGMSGARHGACTMIGGNEEAYKHCRPLFDDLSIAGGSLYVGPAGAGHFAKMVHNGIEYGMMQAIAEGFEVLEKSNFGFDFQKVAELWNHGSVVRSWLMELTANAFSADPHLDAIRGRM